MPMKMLQTLARLATNSRDLAFGHKIGCNHICQASALHILHDDPEIILPQETVDVVDNIRMTRRTHDKNLVDDQVLLRLLVEVHLLDGDRQVGTDLVCGVHASTGTLANFGEIAIQARRVGVRANGLETLDNVLSIHSVLLLLPPAWGCLPCGVLTLEFGNCGSWASSGRSTRRGALAGAGALASGRSRRDAGCVWRARTRCSGVGRASFVLCCAGALDVGDSGVAFALCLGTYKLVNCGGRLGRGLGRI